jgi:hypothetical protein
MTVVCLSGWPQQYLRTSETALGSCLVEGFPISRYRRLPIYIEWQNGLRGADIRREMFVESPFPHPSVMVRKEWVESVGGYQEHGWPEDYDLWLRLYLAGAHFGKVPQVLLEWREAPERLTRTDSRYSLENFLRLKAWALKNGPLQGREAVFIWGAGMMGRRLGKQLQLQKARWQPISISIREDRHRRGCHPGARGCRGGGSGIPIHLLAAVGAGRRAR